MTPRTLPTFTGSNRTGELQRNFQEKILRRNLQVARVEEVTPRYRRILLAGEDLAAGYPFARFAPSDHLKVYFPNPETGDIVAYRETDDGGWEVDSDTHQPIRRDYTPRAWDPESRELTIDFVVHEHGPAGRWARDAEPGDDIVVMGPRANWLLPQNYPHYLAAGDETALPAIARIIEEAPAGAHVCALVEIAEAAGQQKIVPGEGVTVDLHWVHRDTDPVEEGHVSPLETAVRRVGLPANGGEVYVFAAGETHAMKAVRRYFRRELGLPKRQVHVDGYWKQGTPNHNHHSKEIGDD